MIIDSETIERILSTQFEGTSMARGRDVSSSIQLGEFRL